MNARKNVPVGMDMTELFDSNKERIKSILGCTEKEWKNWRWQIRNRISSTEVLSQIFQLSEEEIQDLNEIENKFRWAFTPYFASLMNPKDKNCPIRKQMIPTKEEMMMTGVADFSGEEFTSPVKNMVRWYPDRVAVHLTNICAGFCRHCLRRRKIGEQDDHTEQTNLDEIFEYIADHKEIRDVLFTGGDPFLFSRTRLDSILTELDRIEHVEIRRIGTRCPIVLPQRVDQKLCNMLANHHPLFINIQVNHPKEITEESAHAINMLTRAGIPIGNQTVLLKGINDSPVTMKTLFHELLKVRVKPYYLYHCQGTIGIEHFRTPVETGVEILESLRGYTTGLAVPDYIITPPGYGKTPYSPQYEISSGDGFKILRNWEGAPYKYKNPSSC